MDKSAGDNSNPSAPTSADQFVGFQIDGQEFAIPIGSVQEIIVLREVVKIPQVDEYVEGVSNLRGTIIPIINLRRLFGKDATPLTDNSRTIVVNVGTKTVGCIVDAVTQVLSVPGDAIQAAPDMVTGESNRYLSGFAKLEERVIVLLNSDELLDPEKLEEVHQAGLFDIPPTQQD